MRKTDNKSIKLILDLHKVISLNDLYVQKHWSKRKELADYVHDVVFKECKWQKIEPIKGKVDIEIIAYQRGRLIDSSNVAAKLYEDGLKIAGIIKDDTPQYVRRVTTESRGANKDYVVITLRKI